MKCSAEVPGLLETGPNDILFVGFKMNWGVESCRDRCGSNES